MRALLTVVVLLALAAPAGAQVLMQASEAAGPYVKRGEPFAITVTVTNQGAPVEAVASIGISDRTVVYGTLARCEQSVSLPSGSRKSFLLLMPSFDGFMMGGSNPQLPILLKTKSGEELARHVVSPSMLIDDDFLVLAIGPVRSGFEFLLPYKKAAPNRSRPLETRVSYPDPATLADHWAAYRSADVVILRHPGRLGLTDAQQRALLDWAASGGAVLVIPSGDPNEMPPLLAEALPARIQGAGTLRDLTPGDPDLGTLDLPALRLQPDAGSSTLLSLGSEPVLVSKRRGRGLIVLASADLGARDFFSSDAAAMRWYRDHIFKAVDRQEQGLLHVGTEHVLERSLQMQPPSLGFLTLFMLAYVLLAGPINYLVLKRLDRLVWMFLTVPVVALVFTGVSYGMSAYSKGTRVVLRQASVVHLGAGSPDAFTATWFSLFSPQRDTYDLVLPGASLVPRELGHDASELITSLRDGFRLEDLKLDMWSMRRFQGATVQQLPGSVEVDLDPRTGRITARNLTGLPLKDCVVWHEGRTSQPFHLGTQDVAVHLDSSRLHGTGPIQTWLEGVWLPSGVTDETKQALIHSLAEQIAMVKSPRTVLLGWSERPPLEVGVSSKSPAREALTLVVVRVR